ncbi:unnamed protein product [Paramecium pentaurelia]|uniref:Transmembrane protein n=1 Tax=Paramecium pentaurelia TaxID=43138 RepID=A0A8S1T1H9_9CILI|nr:unnamed protein product [Paramecium pentaurelia]
MQILYLLTLFCILSSINAQCELVNDQCSQGCNKIDGICVAEICNSFINKLGDPKTNPFKGTIQYIDETIDLNITITYTDPKFIDTTQQGITQGENTASCLSLNLYKYQNSEYKIKDSSSYTINYINDGSSTRAYQFIIPSKDFIKELQLSDDGTIFSFHGYYSLDFSIGKLEQRVIYFDFNAGIDRETTGNRNTTFGSLSTNQSIVCNPECRTSVNSSLKFCSDETCAQPIEKVDLYLNDQIWIKQTLTKEGTQNYYLINPEIYFTGDKLFKKATILQQKINQKGYAMYLIKVEIAWTFITISAKATISSTAGSRILDEQNQSQTLGVTQEIDCIKYKESNQCIECDQSLNVNNVDSPQEDGCPISGNILIIGILISMNFLI